MCIDLKNNKLHIGTTGTATTFLSESELPDCARLTSLSEEEARRQSEKAAKESEDRALAEALAASSKEGNSGGSSGSSASGATQHGDYGLQNTKSMKAMKKLFLICFTLRMMKKSCLGFQMVFLCQ